MATNRLTFQELWGYREKTPTAANDLDLILPSAISLPLAYWLKNFFFKGMADTRLAEETRGDFPAIPKRKGTHPVFASKPVLNHIGFAVCPCSSQPQYATVPWIEKGRKQRRKAELFVRMIFKGDRGDHTAAGSTGFFSKGKLIFLIFRIHYHF
jgi:hypothetical protein